MLKTIEVENFQSIEKAHIELGWFTVITGPTGSGKSALLRAVRLVTFNRRGTDFIRHGAKTCKVAIGDQDEGWAVGIERGGRGKDSYRIARPPEDPLSSSVDVQTFTKLGGKVPDEVADVLQLSELNFAAQFDRPFLLDESGGNVAKTLGELTNVTVVLTAAAAGAARKRQLSAELKAARSDVERLEKEAERFADLPERDTAVAEAEGSLRCAQDVQARLEKLEGLVALLKHRQGSLAALKQRAASLTPPDTTWMDELSGKVDRLRQLYLTLTAAMGEAAHWRESREAAAREEAVAAEALHDTLIAAGTCPTCGRATADVERRGQA